ncbi:MAG: flagellar biosynthesis protein FlhF, partial [Candidatus Saccharimonas sp.]|nr:flagellar biosynthesis protein FlhF [Planctomycetaceae bacterium]
RTFKAATVDDALAQIRREMGLDAVVVETKRVARRSLLPWCSSRQEVEVKATRAPVPRRAASSHQSSGTKTRAVAATSPKTLSAAMAHSRQATASATTELARPRRPLAADLAPPPSLLSESGPAQNRIAPNEVPPAELPVHRPRIVPPVRRESLAPAPSSSKFDNAPIVTDTHVTSPDIEQRLESLQQMIAELGRRTRPRGLVEIPPELFAHYLTLIEADVDDEIARELIAKLQQHAAPGQLAETASTTSLLAALIEREIRCAEPLTPKRGCRQIAMLVGPTGVGKTTTIAKLAGRFGMSDGLRVGLITVDTYRVAAVDQLRTYAEIIDLPMQVVTSPEQLSTALALFADFDLVLIDTAGRSPHDDRRLEELKQLVDAATPDHIYLVLSLAYGAKSLRAAAERFAAVRPTSLVLTKLDEATGCGALLSATRDIALPVTYLTAGQEVPRDIEPANPCRIARLILGRDRLDSSPN